LIFLFGTDCVFCLGRAFRDKKANQSTSGEPASRAAVASYVASISADLAAMSRKTGLETLGYLLEMVRLEAESTSRQSNGPNGG
jgi:hypothetical protein